MSRFNVLPSALLVGVAVFAVGCGVSDDSPETVVNHEESGKDFIRVNDIYMIGSTNEESTTSGAAEIIGGSSMLRFLTKTICQRIIACECQLLMIPVPQLTTLRAPSLMLSIWKFDQVL